MTPSELILRDLVAFDTTSAKSNLPLIDHVQTYLAGLGISARLIPDATGTKANLWATIGPDREGGLVLNGHTDCVPVTGEVWETDPFTLTERDGRLYGRGSADMKGFLAVALAAVPDLIAMNLERPVHLAFSHDEEIGCIGVRGLLRDEAARQSRPAVCIVGEPTLMHGRHRPQRVGGPTAVISPAMPCIPALTPLGQNAIESAAELVVFLRSLAAELALGPQDADFDLTHSTLSVGRIDGGTAINIVPSDASVTFEFRNLAEVDQQAIFDRIEAEVRTRILSQAQARYPAATARFEQIYEYPAHAISAEAPLVVAMKHIVGRNDHSKVAFGAEAGLFLREWGLATVLCGPGSITVAHRPDEYVERSQLAAADVMVRRAAQVFCKG